MGVPSPQLVCEYLACLEMIDRIPGDPTFYGPQGRPFESQHVVKKVSKPLSLSELRFMEAVRGGCATPMELARHWNCSRQWIDFIAFGLLDKGYITAERHGRRIFFSSTGKEIQQKRTICFELKTPEPVQSTFRQ